MIDPITAALELPGEREPEARTRPHGLEDPTEETLPEDLPGGGLVACSNDHCPARFPESEMTPVQEWHFCPSCVEGLAPSLPVEERGGALTLYLARQGGERVGDGLEASALLALQSAQAAIIAAYDDPEEEGWEEARSRDMAALEISAVTLHPGDWRTLGALLDLPEREARREFSRLSRMALPAPTVVEIVRLCRAADGAGRLEDVIKAVLANDWTRLRALQLGILGGGR